MATKYYSPSINILRDKNEELDYIPTRNGETAFNSIIKSYENGVKAFCLIGAYGTGKSAFILAFDKVLKGESKFFKYHSDRIKKPIAKFIIGEYDSFEDQFRKSFGIDKDVAILKGLEKEFAKSSKKGETLIIVVDEFGKHLEYAAANSAEKDMFFFQKLAELVNAPENDVILLTTLHQPFEGYSAELNDQQKKEWKKVSGRYIEVPFNEPVEQLLQLAAQHIENLGITHKGDVRAFKALFNAIQDSKAFPLKDYFSIGFAQKVYPFDLLSASTLILAFQTYGQNERSLFNFLKADDYLGLQDLTEDSPYFALPEVYDYLIHNFGSSLSHAYSTNNVQWRAIMDAIETAETLFDKDLGGILKLIKVIGLLNIFGKPGQTIDHTFLEAYGKYALKISNTIEIIELLERRQIIRFQSFSSKFVLFKGTDFDISQALIEANNIVSKDFSVIDRLTKYFSFPILQAKKAYYENGTPRYFEFKLVESLTNFDATDSIDGYIHLIINYAIDESKLQEHSSKTQYPAIYGWLQNSEQIKDTIYEIEKVKWVREQAKDDSVVQKELSENQTTLVDQLNKQFTSGFYGAQANVKWFYKGHPNPLNSSRELNKHLSVICDDYYKEVPRYKNESINRQKVQGTISAARKVLFAQLIDHEDKELLDFDPNLFPPQRTIYQSLLADTGIHRLVNGKWQLGEPTEAAFNFMPLWNICESFFEECVSSPRKLSDLIEKLKQQPLGLKLGFIETWIPIYLIIKKNDFAFYEQKRFIPDLTSGTIEAAMSQPQNYFIHTFKLSGEKARLFNQYRYFLNQAETEEATRETFIETVKPFLNFYKRLTEYTKQTEMLSKNASRLKVAIKDADDAEKVFFEDIPRALGYSGKDLAESTKVEEFTLRLKDATSELSAAQSKLFNLMEEVINHEIGDVNLSFPENKEALQSRFQKLKLNELNTKQKVFYQRVVTALDDRKSWISSIAVAIVKKTLDNFTDNDYKLFQTKFPQYIHELDNLTELSKGDVDQEKEDVLKLEITSFVKGVQNKLIRLPKKKSKELLILEQQIKPLLPKGKRQENIALLIKLLQDEIENGE